jgi:PRTRC genetic system ThiF family protein
MPEKPYKNLSHAETSVEELVMETHHIHPELLERQVRVLVVGCGGTGSAVVAGLPYLHQSLSARGHPGGLHVTVLDGDTISPTNCVRQPFARSEVGLNKAVVLVNRLNLFWGLKWDAIPAHLKPGNHISRGYSGDDLRAHIVLGCVDTRGARATIHDAVSNWSTVSYWLDLGNSADSGQFILGEPLNERNRRSRLRLRSAAELYPEICDQALDNEREPSCSAVEALERQELYVNSTLAQHALALLAQLFRYGEITYHGGFINLASGVTSVLGIDPQCWRRTRRVNKHYMLSRRGQQDAFDVGSSQERADGSDLRVLSAINRPIH